MFRIAKRSIRLELAPRFRGSEAMRQTPEEMLVEAEASLLIAERNVSRQRETVAALERTGRDARAARVLLATLEATHRTQRIVRDRIRRQLAEGTKI